MCWSLPGQLDLLPLLLALLVQKEGKEEVLKPGQAHHRMALAEDIWPGVDSDPSHRSFLHKLAEGTAEEVCGSEQAENILQGVVCQMTIDNCLVVSLSQAFQEPCQLDYCMKVLRFQDVWNWKTLTRVKGLEKVEIQKF